MRIGNLFALLLAVLLSVSCDELLSGFGTDDYNVTEVLDSEGTVTVKGAVAAVGSSVLILTDEKSNIIVDYGEEFRPFCSIHDVLEI